VRIAAILVAILTLAAFRPDPEPVADDNKALDGTWKVTLFENNGKAEADRGGTTILIAKGVMTVKDNDRDEQATFTIDPKKKPKEIDLVPLNTGVPGKLRIQGIYKIEKNKVTFSFVEGPDAARPKVFESKGRQTLLVLERDKM
jgi:uncharacterized protein (TIGR03067 family)